MYVCVFLWLEEVHLLQRVHVAVCCCFYLFFPLRVITRHDKAFLRRRAFWTIVAVVCRFFCPFWRGGKKGEKFYRNAACSVNFAFSEEQFFWRFENFGRGLCKWQKVFKGTVCCCGICMLVISKPCEKRESFVNPSYVVSQVWFVEWLLPVDSNRFTLLIFSAHCCRFYTWIGCAMKFLLKLMIDMVLLSVASNHAWIVFQQEMRIEFGFVPI